MRHLRLASLVATLAAAASSAPAATLLSESFAGAGGALNGTTDDTAGVAWQSGPAFLDDGTINRVVAGGANGEAAFLPFVPAPGNIYSLSATVANSQGSWVALGFMPALPSGGDWTVTDFSVRHSNNGAHAWILTRASGGNDQEAFNGPGTANGAFGGDIADPNSPVDIGIVLNTADPTWTAEYFFNGASQGVFNLAATANTGIAGIGLSRDRNDAAGPGASVSNLVLTGVTAVPEPAAAGLAALALAAVAAVRRKD
ncbi:hypothetical protein Pla108_17880 [Botrimarina colliarenosi]|uniref:PEP-CTERM protein-sorting domain-containing protein n=1 Tax=Botrimarina colliarenosi TaxID=2528001 RepID=A0A5C6AE01_9BACT|nr:hypothetical protein [Botrimarina colliarenosi]TWT97636.1 hypothetical protein Pla108_17880 [Botrimarina colliarenosi]